MPAQAGTCNVKARGFSPVKAFDPVSKSYEADTMKSPVKLLLSAALAVFGWSVKAKDDASFHLANGIKVTPVEVKPDDLSQLLDAKIWKFDVVLPDRTKPYSYALNLCRYGRVVAQLGNMSLYPGPGNIPRTTSIKVAMIPTGDSFSKPGDVKYQIGGDSGGISGTFSNPFGAGLSYSETPEVIAPNNMIYLMSGDKNVIYGLANQNAVSIALKIEPIIIKH